jgi:RNA polymerase sigma-70 factor (ECF subfamily)
MDFSNSQDIEKLIKDCLNGDKNSQNLLYKTLYGKMMSVCLRYSENSTQAKDIFQEGMFKVFQNLKKYEYKGSFEGWVRRIFVNHAIDNIRRNKEYIQDFKDSTLYENIEEDTIDNIDDEEIPDISADIILEYIQKLSPAYRTVFNLYIIENYTHKQISEELKISIGTSKSNLAKSKVQLRNMLKKEFIKIGK